MVAAIVAGVGSMATLTLIGRPSTGRVMAGGDTLATEAA